jgi:hypothetical protein
VQLGVALVFPPFVVRGTTRLSTRGSGPKNVKFSNGTYIKSDMPESINR